MLLIFAHPDDEAISCGGTIAKYVENGWRADLICATRGEAGGDAEVRTSELEASTKILGIFSLSFLDYKDGTLKDQHAGEIEDKLYKKMIELAPDVVVTMESDGISNHPDHTKLTLSTTYAFQKYAYDLAYPDRKMTTPKRNLLLKSEEFVKRSLAETEGMITEPKLYYVCLPDSVVTYLQKKKVLPVESFGKPWRGVLDKFVTTVIDIKRFRTTKIRALKEHISQLEDFRDELNLSGNPEFESECYVLRMVGLTEVFMGKNDRVANRL